MGGDVAQRLTTLARDAVAARLATGDRAVDATVGNGHDLHFLAGAVGADGHVWGFDIQEGALCGARRRLPAHLQHRVTLLHHGHEHMGAHVAPGVAAIMFNLGYLPGGDHSVTTRVDTTIAALEAALGLLAPGGCISVLAYTGHPGGREEAQAVAAWLREQPPSCRWVLLNPEPPAARTPRLYLVSLVRQQRAPTRIGGQYPRSKSMG